jgi:hypothetical protein
MAVNARAAWAVYPKPWEVEDLLIDRLSPPLNLAGAGGNRFRSLLAATREEMRTTAKRLPVLR